MPENDHQPFSLHFYVTDPGAPEDPAEKLYLQTIAAGAMPVVGDLVHDDFGLGSPRVYQVKARYFDPVGNRVALVMETMEAAEKNPFSKVTP